MQESVHSQAEWFSSPAALSDLCMLPSYHTCHRKNKEILAEIFALGHKIYNPPS